MVTAGKMLVSGKNEVTLDDLPAHEKNNKWGSCDCARRIVAFSPRAVLTHRSGPLCADFPSQVAKE